MKSSKLNAAFGKTLARLRRERGWTQEFLSFECDLTRNYVSLLERGESSPTLNTISSLAEALNIGAEELIKMTFEELRKTSRDSRRI
ncbi:helix-turn-helix domain-containing protein [Cupriavidus nantongensis]|uniref:helix-turn-helix domain-containing protein n=1 Tax=Cupriavidus nantongensis TaxID=1796606 RepID=UPI0009EE0BDE|nr:helix-turn-helix transcriptional regulator [Cupriavidus nantongensis]